MYSDYAKMLGDRQDFNMKKKKNNSNLLFIAIAAILVVIFFVSVFFIKYYIDHYGSGNGIVTRYQTELYELPKNANEYQIDIYEELAKTCNKIEDLNVEGGLEEIASLVVKSFIADHFTWSNKRGSYDVGGLDYVYGPQFLNIQAQARNYYYYDLDILLDQYGKENLPTVVDINIVQSDHSQEKFHYEYEEYDYGINDYVTKEVDFDYYTIGATWEYQSETSYDETKLPDRGLFMVINRNGRLEIAFYHEDYLIIGD